ncbi:polysaccharide biosynthesis/export family protein [Kordiimonas aquimaris]|uniref:polysaccharide biosynthesis/export family protein n=1 Tax=Kordiimonas aquimaris TaxID=707591 RepID=UPI0021D0A757|nr:polysaccharide biosynthesis/export family protein [Kordiimonas aquimaris]
MFNLRRMKKYAGILAAVFLGQAIVSFAATAQTASAAQDATPQISTDETVNTIDQNDAPFGAWIFGGEFANQSFIGFNPTYEISTGDKISLQLWGGYDFAGELTVDAQGNIFVPKVGPVAVIGVQNKDLNVVVSEAVKRVFRKNVGVYANLGAAEPVKVFVTGFVQQPGLYAGHASDSVLFFLDKAGGIDPQRGSFLNVRVLRGGQEYKSINLYDFILSGSLSQFQIADGDTVIVSPVLSQAGVFGGVQNKNLFEFEGATVKLSTLLDMARPYAQSTHVRISRNNSQKIEVQYMRIEDAIDLDVLPGDVVDVTSDKNQGTISVRVEGEHTGAQELVVPYGATLGELLSQVRFGPNAQKDAVQLLRESVKQRQKETLQAQLRALEASVLTARSKTAAEADLRQREAELILQWVERARDVETKGQVSLAGSASADDILLEQGDIIRIPRTSNLVMVHGDVLFPSAMAYQGDQTARHYIEQAGGFTQSASAANVLLLHRDGSFRRLSKREVGNGNVILKPGDEIFVLPRVQTKSFQLAQDIITIFYQLALSAGVVLRL